MHVEQYNSRPTTSEFTFFFNMSGHMTLAAGGCCWQKAAQRQPTSRSKHTEYRYRRLCRLSIFCGKHAARSTLFVRNTYNANYCLQIYMQINNDEWYAGLR
jgi:hypothetical protein